MRDGRPEPRKGIDPSTFTSLTGSSAKAWPFEARSILRRRSGAPGPTARYLIAIMDALGTIAEWPQPVGPLKRGPPQPAHLAPPVAAGAVAVLPQDLALSASLNLSAKDPMRPWRRARTARRPGGGRSGGSACVLRKA